jgi:hypothetical protein
VQKTRPGPTELSLIYGRPYDPTGKQCPLGPRIAFSREQVLNIAQYTFLKGSAEMATRVRSAVNGRFVKKGEATKHPKTSVTEKVKKPEKKR